MYSLPLSAIDKLESILVAELRTLLKGVRVGTQFPIEPSADICDSLELFLPRLLRTKHPEWASESLDGFFIARAIRNGPTSALLIGTCIIMSDQTVTPFQVELAMSPTAGALELVRVYLGEPGDGILGISGPAVNSKAATALLASVAPRIESVQWSYKLEFRRRSGGSSRPPPMKP